jgi:NADH-quinone oxidoreductase subunit F
VAQGKFKEAYDVNIWANPLPSVCARVCHHPCETTCKAGKFGSPVAVRDLKRFVTDQAREQGTPAKVKPPAEKKDKVAIVGSGPAGLMAGWELGKMGYQVTIYEAEAVPGGMLSWGIPEYRLPKDILYSEIDRIQDVGVEIQLNTTIGKDLTIDDLFSQGNKAVFIAAGTPINTKMGIPGEDTEGVTDPIAFLKKYNLEGDAAVGKKVAVVGGGNTAFDAARTAWRLGAEVTLLYRRTRNEMPANVEDIAEAIEEGINIEYLTIPVEAYSENGKLNKIRCQRMELSKFDKSGRRHPVPIEGSDFELEVDTLIPAIGAEPDLQFLKDKAELQISKWKTLEIDTETMATNVPGIFAAGDVVTGPATVLEAMGGGKRAADSIDRFLRDASLLRDYQPTQARLEVPPVPFVPEDDEEEPARVEISRLAVQERQGNFNEVEKGITPDQAVAEAKRCLRCDLDSLRLRGEL